MKPLIIFLNLMVLFVLGCNNKKESVNVDINNNLEHKTRLIAFSKSNLKSENDNTKLFLAELSKYYPEKYECSTPDDSAIRGDINQDGYEDILFRYSVDDIENRIWVACGWFVAFSNKKNEFENFIYYDWTSGRGGLTQFDFGFPNSINDGVIYSEIQDYKEGDGSCCPSITRKMSFTFDKELLLMSPLNIETVNN
jgi:hypothetical protein